MLAALFVTTVLAAKPEEPKRSKVALSVAGKERAKTLPAAKKESSGNIKDYDSSRGRDQDKSYSEGNDRGHRKGHKGSPKDSHSNHGDNDQYKGHQESGAQKGHDTYGGQKGHVQYYHQGNGKGHRDHKAQQHDHRGGHNGKGNKPFRRVHKVVTHEMYFDDNDDDDYDNKRHHDYDQGRKTGHYGYRDGGYRGHHGQDNYGLHSNPGHYGRRGHTSPFDHFGDDRYNDGYGHEQERYGFSPHSYVR